MNNPTHKKGRLVITALVVLALLTGGILWAVWPPGELEEVSGQAARALENKDEKEIVHNMLSDEFGKVSEDARYEYFIKAKKLAYTDGIWVVPPAGMSEKERNNFRKNVASLFMRDFIQQINAYSELSQDQRGAFLDRLLYDWIMRLQKMERDRLRKGLKPESWAGHNRDFNKPPHKLTAELMQKRMEMFPPEQRARNIQFMVEMGEHFKNKFGMPFRDWMKNRFRR